jgi:hypothetical protein
VPAPRPCFVFGCGTIEYCIVGNPRIFIGGQGVFEHRGAVLANLRADPLAQVGTLAVVNDDECAVATQVVIVDASCPIVLPGRERDTETRRRKRRASRGRTGGWKGGRAGGGSRRRMRWGSGGSVCVTDIGWDRGGLSGGSGGRRGGRGSSGVSGCSSWGTGGRGGWVAGRGNSRRRSGGCSGHNGRHVCVADMGGCSSRVGSGRKRVDEDCVPIAV